MMRTVCNIMEKVLNSKAGVFLINSRNQNTSDMHILHIFTIAKQNVYLENCRKYPDKWGTLIYATFAF